MLEREVEKAMGVFVKKRGGLFYKFVSPGNAGVPDRIVVTPGGVVWFVEVKTDKGKLNALQKNQIAKLTKNGANVRTVYGIDDALAFLAALFDAAV